MKMTSVWNELKKLNKVAFIVAVVHFFVSFFTDRFIFDYVLFDVSTTKNLLRTIETFGVKAVFLLVLVFLWQMLFRIPKNRNKMFLKIAAGYFACMMALLLLIWPGIWRMDEFGILSSSVQLFPHFWQNYITSVFYVLALMIFPFPAGVIIVQCICISLIVARIVTKLWDEEMRVRRKGSVILLLLPFFMLPVLDSNMYPIRMSLYAFLELWLFAELFFAATGRQTFETKKKEQVYFILLSVLAAIVTIWRTEAIYYIVAYPVLLVMIGKGREYIKTIVIYILITVVLFVPQKVGERLTSGQQYELTSVVLPLVPLVVAAESDSLSVGNHKELLGTIDRVVNVDVLLEGAAEGKSGINLFWGSPEFQRTYDSAEFAQFKSAFYQLILKYPDVFLKERWQTFVDSSDLLENTTELFVKEGVMNYEVFASYPLSKPISNELRTSVIKKIELRSSQDYQTKLAVTDLVYSAIPAVLVLMVCALWLLFKKRWTKLVLILTPLAKVPLVFLTAPSRLFMYYYSVYLIGYCVLFYIIYQLCNRRKL